MYELKENMLRKKTYFHRAEPNGKFFHKSIFLQNLQKNVRKQKLPKSSSSLPFLFNSNTCWKLCIFLFFFFFKFFSFYFFYNLSNQTHPKVNFHLKKFALLHFNVAMLLLLHHFIFQILFPYIFTSHAICYLRILLWLKSL